MAILSSSPAHILLVQELFWGPLVPQRSDTDPTGVPVFSSVSHPLWDIFLPPLGPDPAKYAHVTTFVRKEVCAAMSVMPDPILKTYYSVSITVTPTSPLPPITFINFYHHIDDRKNPLLNTLLALHMPADQCLLLCRDFNTHSSLWSPGNLHPSLWAPAFEDWMETEILFSLVPEGAITQQCGSDKPFLIDLMIGNPAFLDNPSFPTSCLISFNDSLGLDHAALTLFLPLSFDAPPPSDLHDEWVT
jgi:Endonuclease-reverse transcriptase